MARFHAMAPQAYPLVPDCRHAAPLLVHGHGIALAWIRVRALVLGVAAARRSMGAGSASSARGMWPHTARAPHRHRSECNSSLFFLLFLAQYPRR